MAEQLIFKITPVLKNYLWGGERLKAVFGEKGVEFSRIAESWEISTHPDGECLVNLGKGETLLKNAVGDLPFIVKYIDAADDLSVQVHPDDEYAQISENGCGKNEMWLILEAQDDAAVLLGFKRNVSRKEVEKSAESGELLSLINKIPVKRGEVYFIPAGTVHAIGKGCLICEIQQRSNLTYRLYDYNRKDAEGNPRTLHIEKALDVLNYKKYTRRKEHGLKYYFEKLFDGYKLNMYAPDGEKNCFKSRAGKSFALVYEGTGEILSGGQKAKTAAGDSWFMKGKEIKITGNCKAIIINAV